MCVGKYKYIISQRD